MSNTPTGLLHSFRQLAEEKLRDIGSVCPETIPPAEMQKLYYDLQVHKIALEMQNETIEELNQQLVEQNDQLEKIKNELSIVLENAPIGISRIIDRKQVWVNPGTVEILQYSKEEMQFQTTRNLYPSDEAYEKLGREAYPTLAQGKVYKTVQDLIRKDGVHILVRYISKAVEPADMSKGTIWLLEDITEQKATEDALLESKEKYRAMIDAFHGYIYICSNDYRIEFMSEKLIQRTGHDATGEHCYKALHDLDSVCEWCVNEQVFAGKTVFWETKSPKDNRWYEISNTPIFNPNGTVSKQAMFTDITDRKRVEMELRQFQLFFNISSDLMCIANITGNFTKINPVWEKTLGYTEGELLNRPFMDFVHPDDIEKTLSAINDNLLVGIPVFRFENRYRCKDGTYRWLSWTSNPFPEQGITYSIARDVTESKHVERELERFHLFFNSSTDMMCIADPDGAFLHINPACSQILGYSDTELISRPFIDFVHPDDKQDTLDEMVRQQQLGSSFNFENRYMCKDGSVRWLSWRANFNKDEGVTYATARDFTEQKLAEEKLKESERDLRLLTEAMPQIVWITRPDGWATYLNHQWVDYTGLSLEESCGDGWNKPLHPDDQQRVWDAWRKATAIGSDYSLECRVRRADGVYTWWLIRGVPVRDETGKITKWFGTCTDIEQIKQTEEALIKSKIDAESANRFKSEFLANMSHEIRTPLNSVFGNAQLLEMTDLTEEQVELIQNLKESGKNLLSLINDILDLSKIEAGKLKINLDKLSLHTCISEIIRLQKNVANDKGLLLRADISEDVPHIFLGDQLRIKQILLNLVGNAIKFTSQGGVTISAQLLEQNSTSALIRISVRDTGIGISTEALKEIFSPFVQEDGSINRKFGGTGLGLAICQRLTELMGGSISVESLKGAGSCFAVTLPLSVEADMITEKLPQKELFRWEGSPLRILFAEDNQTNATLGAKLLNKLGHEVTMVNDGQECLAALEHGNFDIVLMDIQMPIMNGEEALREIRRREQGTSLHQRVIAMTAYSYSEEKDRFLKEGFDSHISKPIEFDKLISEIKLLMGMGSSVEVTHE